MTQSPNHSMLWGGRFSEDPNALAFQYNASLPFDQRLWREDIRGSAAWARALARAGVLTIAESEIIAGGLERVRAEFESGAFEFKPSDEDIHTAVERRLSELIGAPGGKLHTGRSRNDQVAADFRLWVMSAETEIVAQVRAVQNALAAQAEAHAETLMPGYTHLQRAQPITFGHWLMSQVWALEQDAERWAHSRARAAVCPLGGAALAGTAYPIDRHALAADLGFARPSENSLHSTGDRDFAAEFLFNSALMASHLSRLAEALILYSSAEFGFVTLADAYSSGSSLMPQKKNPDVLELTRGKAGTLIGHLTGLLAMMKGLPSAYDKDLQEDKPPVFATYDALTLMLPVLAGAIGTMAVHSARMASALESSLLATELADYLVRKGVPFREAHHLVGRVVQKASQQPSAVSRQVSDLTLDELRAISPAFEADVAEVWSFAVAVARRSAVGGTSPESVRAQVAEARQKIAASA